MCSNVSMLRSRGEDRPGPHPAADFDEMYRREAPRIAAVAAALTGSRETGADLANEAMLRAYREWATVGGLERPGAWVRRVVINLATDVHRRAQRERKAVNRMEPRDHVEMRDPVDAAFWAAVRRLPDQQRTVIALHYLDDLSVSSIGEILQVSAGAVKNALFMARRSLAVALGAQEVQS